jgi:DNA-binding CsgD family transcriptional regulator
MRGHLRRAAELASEHGQAAARCEALARLAVESARLGAERGDESLLDEAERAGREVEELAPFLSGHPPWVAQAEAALATAALWRGNEEVAADLARSAMSRLQAAMQEDLHLDVLLPVSRVLRATGAPEWEQVRGYLQLSLAMIAQRTLDETLRVRWFRGPLGRAMTELAGPIQTVPVGARDRSTTDEVESALLRSLIQGRTNEEIAEEMGTDEVSVARQLGELFTRIGASSRAEATAFAFRERVL